MPTDHQSSFSHEEKTASAMMTAVKRGFGVE